MNNSYIKRAAAMLLAAVLCLSAAACGGTAPQVQTAPSGHETLPAKPVQDSTAAPESAASAPQTQTPPAKESTEAPAPETEPAATETEPAAAETEPDVTEPDTGAAEPASQESPEDIPEKTAQAFAAYRKLLEEHRDLVNSPLFVIRDPNGDPERRMQVLIVDLLGDAVPELAFAGQAKNESGTDVQRLWFYTFVDGAAELYYEADVDIAAGGGKTFCLFTNGEDKEPWLLVRGGEYKTARETVERVAYERNADGTYSWTGTRFSCVENDEDAAPEERNGKDTWIFCDAAHCEELTRDAYYARLNPVLGDRLPLFHNYSEYYLPEDLAGAPMHAVTYDEAMEIFGSYADDGQTEEAMEPNGMTSEPYETIQGTYFMHGGDWTADLTVYADGSFAGEFCAHYLNNGRRHYDVAEFHGLFGGAEQADGLTWTIRVESIFSDGEIGEEWIEDEGTDDEAEYVRVEDLGNLKEGDVLTVYLPGTDTAVIPEEFFMWVRSSHEQMPGLERPAIIGGNAFYFLYPEQD